MKLIKSASLLIASLTLTLSGCVSTDVRESSVPPPPNFQITKIAINVVGNSNHGVQNEIEQDLLEKLLAMGIDVYNLRDIAPYTRKVSTDELIFTLDKNDIDAVLWIAIGSSARSSELATIINNSSTYGSGTVSGNNFSYNSSTSGQTTPIFKRTRSTKSTGVLYDAKNLGILWQASSQTIAGGNLFQGDGTTASNIADEYLSRLVKAGSLKDLSKTKKVLSSNFSSPSYVLTQTPKDLNKSYRDKLAYMIEACQKKKVALYPNEYSICKKAGFYYGQELTLKDKLNNNFLNDKQSKACALIMQEGINCYTTDEFQTALQTDEDRKIIEEKLEINSSIMLDLLKKKITVGKYFELISDIYK
jgi:hypothetical protein